MSRHVAAWVVLLLAWACARQGAPPGGPPDRIPPYVISTWPDTFSVVEPFGSAVEIEFNERISERSGGGSLNDAVEISPRTSEVRVKHKRRSLEVTLRGGFVGGVVYRVTVRPVVQDMFSNALREPFEFFFSTGPEFSPNALAGIVTDRITGQPVDGARVDAWRADEDSVVYMARTERDGIFAIRTVPAGMYTVRAYRDVNRSFEPNFAEAQALEDGVVLGRTDTLLVDLALLRPDTTAAVLGGAEVVDSVTLRLSFDDYVDSEEPLDSVRVTLEREDGEAPALDRLLHTHEYDAYRQAVADSLAAAGVEEEAPATPGEAPGVPAPPGRLEPPGRSQETAQAPGGEPRPQQDLLALLKAALETEVQYELSVGGLRNIAGVPGGGGSTTVTRPAPPPPDTTATPGDTTAVGDSVVVPDTTAPDTSRAAFRSDAQSAHGGAMRRARPVLFRRLR